MASPARLYPTATILQEWTNKEGKTAWEELAFYNGAEEGEGGAKKPGSAHGITQSTAAKQTTVNATTAWGALTGGVKITGLSFHFYCLTAKVKDLRVVLESGSPGLSAQSIEPSNTTAGWVKAEWTLAELEAWWKAKTFAEQVTALSNALATFKTEKAGVSTVYACYWEVTYEESGKTLIKPEATCTVSSEATAKAVQKQVAKGTVEASAAITATNVKQEQKLAGTAEPTAVVTAKASQKQHLAGTSTVSSSASAAVKQAQGNKATAAASAGITAKVGQKQRLAGTVLAGATATGRVGLGRALAAVVNVLSSATAAVRQKQKLAGTVEASASATGHVTLVELFKAALRAIVTILSHKQATVTVSGGPQATITVVNHRSTVVEVENSPQATITIVNRRQAAIREV